MKKECLICGKEFEGRADIKCCPDCRKENKRICSQYCKEDGAFCKVGGVK